jgi:polyisoprenoid-binding protein YceI
MATTITTTLSTGTWHVDPGASQASSRGMFGLVGVRGTFATSEGDLVVNAAGTHGELRIQAARLNTKNKKRDEHLRSADFFDVVNSPIVRFTLADISPAADGTLINGTLQIRGNKLQIAAPQGHRDQRRPSAASHAGQRRPHPGGRRPEQDGNDPRQGPPRC